MESLKMAFVGFVLQVKAMGGGSSQSVYISDQEFGCIKSKHH